MADKNIQMKQKNGSSWDNLYPKTIGANVTANDGKTFEQHETDTTVHITSAERTTWNGKQAALGYTPINKAGDTMTGTLTLAADPVSALQAATKQYVDAVQQGLDVKQSCRVATTANITLSGMQTIDGVAVVAGDRVLVKDQTTGSANGIYVVASGAWTRATDADATAKVNAGMFTFIEEGTVNADYGWTLTTNNPITLGTTSLTFTQFSGAGQVAAGTGLTKAGSTISLADTSVTPGTYPKVTVDQQGRITLGASLLTSDIPNLDWTKINSGKPTTLAGYGITDATPSSHVGATGTAHGVATTSVNGFMSSADKTKLDGVSAGAIKVVTDSVDPTTANADYWFAVV
jgi:phage-related tail fiber protein